MSRRFSLPARASAIPPHARNAMHPTSSHTSGDEITIDTLFNDLSSSLASLDFDKFFKIFHLQSPVCRFIENLKPAQLKALMLKAFPPELDDGTGYAVTQAVAAKATRKAKQALDMELHDLESMFKVIEEAGLNVGTVRSSLRWMRRRNQRSLESLESFLSQEASFLHQNENHHIASPKSSKQAHAQRYTGLADPESPVFPAASSMTVRERDTMYKSLFMGNSSPRNSRKDPLHTHAHDTEKLSPRKGSHSRRHSEIPHSVSSSGYALNNLVTPSPTPDKTALKYTYNCLLNGVTPPQNGPSYAASGLPSQTDHSSSSQSYYRRRDSLPAGGVLQARNIQGHPYSHSSKTKDAY